MSNPFANSPLWTRYYSTQMGWPITPAVRDLTDGPVYCDSCGSTFDTDGSPLSIGLDGSASSYCFGCGAITCNRCVPTGYGPHQQTDHHPKGD